MYTKSNFKENFTMEWIFGQKSVSLWNEPETHPSPALDIGGYMGVVCVCHNLLAKL